MNSYTKLFAGIPLLLLFSLSLRADIALQVENTTLLQNTPNQVVRILGTYDATGPAIDGVLFNVLVGLGGPDSNLGLLPGLPGNVDGPNITGINLKPIGGALTTFTSNQNVSVAFEQFLSVELLRADSDTPRSAAFTNQLVAQLIVDTTGVALGAYQVDLRNGTLGVSSNFLGGTSGTIATNLFSGTLSVTAVPEPSTLALLALVGSVAVFGVRRKRRRFASTQPL